MSILDADKEGFLRCALAHPDDRSRRAERVGPGAHVRRQGHPVDAGGHRGDPTPTRADPYNLEAGIDPQPLRKKIADITDMLQREDADTETLMGSGRSQSAGRAAAVAGVARSRPAVSAGRLKDTRRRHPATSSRLSTQMHQAAADLHFELAARLRDEIGDLKKSCAR